jgi:lantibiotic modifying enzyme
MTAFLEAAVQIGRAICRSAYWDQEQSFCNWVGRSPLEAQPTGERLTPTVTALGPELYDGTSGVALFLAHLFARTGITEFRRTALGAIFNERQKYSLCKDSSRPAVCYYSC